MSNISVSNASFSYVNNHFIVKDVSLSIKTGEMVGLLGPNGSGKTTLLKLLSGVFKPARGNVSMDGIDIRHIRRNRIAQSIAVVPQQFFMPFSFTVGDVVMLGRTPFIGLLSGEKEQDYTTVNNIMEMIGICNLQKRIFNELSGGERQKVILAMAMAQQPKVLLLDEPTTHLDINHQTEILGLVRELNIIQGITVIAALHDLNMAAMYFDRLIILTDGTICQDGSPVEVLTEAIIEEVFNTAVLITTHPLNDKPHVILLPAQKTGSRETVVK